MKKIKEILNNIIKYFTPMEYISFSHNSLVTGKPVYKYKDAFGNYWLKYKKYSFFKWRCIK